jgi:Zn-dependent protease with chaperone function
MKFLLALICLIFSAAHALTNTLKNTPNRVALKGLDESQFRHPLDRDLTARIQAAPFSDLALMGLRNGFSVIEQGLRLDLLSKAVKVSPQQLPQFHQLLVEACQVLDWDKKDKPMPQLYIQSSTQANAYTLASRGDNSSPIVVVTSALLDQCTELEIQAIIGHELGHLKCEHSLYFTLGGLATYPLRGLPFLGGRIESRLQEWRLAAEYTCDRAALLVAQDPQIVTSGLVKLFAGTSKYPIDPEAFMAQCVEYEELLKNANPLVRASIYSNNQQRTHPLPVQRVAELQKWAESKDYKTIIKSGTKMVTL